MSTKMYCDLCDAPLMMSIERRTYEMRKLPEVKITVDKKGTATKNVPREARVRVDVSVVQGDVCHRCLRQVLTHGVDISTTPVERLIDSLDDDDEDFTKRRRRK